MNQELRIKNVLYSVAYALCAFIIFNVFFFIPIVHAATIYFDTPTTDVGVGDEFEVEVLLDPENEYINAIQGEVLFSPNALTLLDVGDGDSIIALWLERPREQNGRIIFSGIIPGGFVGIAKPFDPELKPGRVVRLLFKAKEAGDTTLHFSETHAFLNNAEATPAELTTENISFSILPQIDTTESVAEVLDTFVDTLPPEPFQPLISQDPALFGGNHFLVFATGDRGLGVSSYAIYESKQEYTVLDVQNASIEWKVAESPYILTDQTLRSYIYVKAVDKAGNVRISILFPQKPPGWYRIVLILAVLFILGVFASLIIVILRRKRPQKTQRPTFSTDDTIV